MSSKLNISVIVDNESWILPYAETLVSWAENQGHNAVLCRDHESIQSGDIAFYLGCIKITPPEILALNSYNLVVHESDLPKGRGFAPMAWQILEGQNSIPICLIEAAEGEVDSGAIFLKDTIRLEGYELCAQWRDLQGQKTVELCQQFLNDYPNVSKTEQEGEASMYERRTPKDSELDPNKTIAEQFDLLRVVDNERYPAFFEHKGKRYILKIEEANDE